MSDKKPVTKLFTWKHLTYLCLAIIVGLAVVIYRNFERKGHLEKRDLITVIITGVVTTMIVFTVVWYGNRPDGERK